MVDQAQMLIELRDFASFPGTVTIDTDKERIHGAKLSTNASLISTPNGERISFSFTNEEGIEVDRNAKILAIRREFGRS